MYKYQVLLSYKNSRQVIWIENKKNLKKGMYYLFDSDLSVNYHIKKYWEIMEVYREENE